MIGIFLCLVGWMERLYFAYNNNINLKNRRNWYKWNAKLRWRQILCVWVCVSILLLLLFSFCLSLFLSSFKRFAVHCHLHCDLSDIINFIRFPAVRLRYIHCVVFDFYSRFCRLFYDYYHWLWHHGMWSQRRGQKETREKCSKIAFFHFNIR